MTSTDRLRVFLTIMKLRIRGHSLRLRVTRPELERLASEGKVIESLPFPAGAELRYELSVDAAATALSATYRDNLISVRIPIADFRQWQREDQVSLRAAGGLTILVEKDFACLTTREGEDDSEAFTDPKVNP
jgi:hypothetical protein